MSLIIGHIETWVPWPAVGVSFLLSPLSGPDKRAFEQQARVYEKGEDNKTTVRVYVDPVKYQMLVGRHCIKNWKSIKGKKPAIVDGATKRPLPFSVDAAETLMTAPPLADWIIQQVEGMSLHVVAEVEAAGKG